MEDLLMNDRSDIDRETSEWLVEAEDGALSPEAQEDFHAWLAANPLHAQTFNDMSRTWRDIAGMHDLGALAPLEVASNDTEPAPSRWWGASATAGAAMVASLAAVAAVLVGFILVPKPADVVEQRYATKLGETRTVRLEDGSSVTLASKSAVVVRFSRDARKVELAQGEAFFDIAAAKERPFSVVAGKSLVRDIGTRFNLNLTDRTLRVTVADGLVQVAGERDPERTGSRLVHPGQRAEVTMAAGNQGPSIRFGPIQYTSAASAEAWREGRLVFDNVRLADLAADLNRQYAPGVKIAPGSVGDLRITASFRAKDIPAFMSTLAMSLPVDVTQDTAKSFTVDATAR